MTKNKGRVVGLDVHPDSFAGAVVEGSDPAQARVLSTSTRVELEQLEQWALRHTSTEDRLVLEASGNAFAVAARLRADTLDLTTCLHRMVRPIWDPQMSRTVG